MVNRIDNLGDYNIARESLKAVGGCWETLYKDIGDTAVAKATPRLLCRGGAYALGGLVVLSAVVYGGQKAVGFVQRRKKMIVAEPKLKRDFSTAIERTEVGIDESQNCSDTDNNKNE